MKSFDRLKDLDPEVRHKSVLIYSDGSSSGRADRPGGWGYVIVVEGAPVDAGAGGHPRTTNNLMEMEAAIQGLLSAMKMGLHREGRTVYLVSDSQYVLGIGSGQMTPSKNLKEAGELKALMSRVGAIPCWIKGHSGEEWNERVDRLAGYGKEQVSR